MGLLYLAIEPYVRRLVPGLLIGWARLLEGRFRDPRVARDVLVGAAFGSVIAFGIHLANALPTWIPILGQTPVPASMDLVRGGRHLVAWILGAANNVVLPQTLGTFCVFFLLRLLVRRQGIAAARLMLVLTLGNLGGENLVLETPFALLNGVLMGGCLARYGLLAGVSMWLFRILLTTLPLPLDFAAPYAFSTVAILEILLGLMVAVTRFSVGSRPLFTGPSLGD